MTIAVVGWMWFGVRSMILSALIIYIMSLVSVFKTIYAWFVNKDYEIGWSVCWILFDIAFITYTFYRFKTHKPGTDHLPVLKDSCIERIKNEMKNDPDPKKFIEGWFFGTDLQDLTRHDLLRWIGGMCFNKHPHQMTKREFERANELLDFVEDICCHKFLNTDQKSSRTMLLTLDPIEIAPRPVLFYAAVKAMSYATRVTLRSLGFQSTSHKNVTTFFRLGSSSALPIVFFHGIGIGVTPYIPFIRSMIQRYPTHTVILFEMPCVAMQLKRNHLLPEQYARIYAGELKRLGIERIHAIGHSLGTTSVCWLDRFFPNLIRSRIFIDPVCFSLWTHHIAKNFVYRSPDKILHYFFKYLVAMEPGIALYLRRYFVWHQNTYYSDQLPRNSKVYLSEADDVVNCDHISSYLERYRHPSRSYTIVPKVKHGHILLTGKYQDIIDDIHYFTQIK